MEGTPTLLNVIFRKITPHKSTFLQLPNYISIHKQKSNRCVASFIELPISGGLFLSINIARSKYQMELKRKHLVGHQGLRTYQKYKLTYCEYFGNLPKMFGFKKIAWSMGMRGKLRVPLKRALGDSIFFPIFVSSAPCASFFSFL